jgi:hypothetical protein
MKTFNIYTLIFSCCFLTIQISRAQTGIGTALPSARLHLNGGSALGTAELPDPTLVPWYNPASPEIYYSRMRWFHDKSAFRVVGGTFTNDGFDIQQVGLFSFASGYETVVAGIGAAALGGSAASGNFSFASGPNAIASGSNSFAHCYSCAASGNNSLALGSKVSTNGREGSFIFGDDSPNANSKNDANDQMMMRFSGGYKFYSNVNSTIGVRLVPSGNAWIIWSDVNKKEKFITVNGDDFLDKITSLKLASWNYKGQDPATFRHYGPMAQDFFRAFGKDRIGTIGADTTINQADFDGVNLIAIQALVKKTEVLEQMNNDLAIEIATVKAQLAASRSDVDPGGRRFFLSKR